MLNFFRCFFKIISTINVFLDKEKFEEINGSFIILAVNIVIGITLFEILGYVPGIYISIAALSIGIVVMIALMKHKFFKKYSLIEIFLAFTFKSYIFCLIFISIYIFFFIQVLLFAFFLFTGENISPKNFETIHSIIVIVICTESILWFTFHIISKKVSLQKIKIKVAQYSALAATISIAFELFKEKEILKMPLGFIALSYLWITYLIELASDEDVE